MFAGPTTQERLTRPPTWILVLALGALGLWIFWGAPAGVRWRTGDWGPHHFLTRELEQSLRDGLGIPHWVLGASTGHSPFEMYPVLTYLVGAGLAALAGARGDVPTVLFSLALGCHVWLCVSVMRLALRFSHWTVAFAVGALSLVDLGGFESGVESVLGVGLMHAALAQCLTLTAFIAGVDFLTRPRLRLAVVIWVSMALGAACHPSTVLFVGTWIVALLAAMPFAPQIRTRRVMLLALHVAIGTAASAWVWWPFMQRVFEYGLPFAFRLPSLGGIVEEVLFALRAPATSFALVLGLGIVGVLFGLAARRPAPLVTAATIVALLLADSDAPYLLSGVAETRAFTRLQPFRFLALARPLLFAQAAYALDLALAGFRARVRPFPTTSRPWRVAVGGVLLLVVLRGAVPYAMNRVAEVRGRTQSEVPDPAGFRALVDWAGTQVGDRLPGRFARLMYQGDSDSNWIHHVAAETGLPVFFLDESSPVGVGRERIEDSSADSLRRFDVRWIASKGEPPTLGDPATERRFGRYYVREWPEWDGKFARVERGAGEVIVTDLRNQKIEVELRNTDRPALVALGTGYYPRWRAHLDGGREVPIYAEPSVAEGWSRVPAAWIPPGRATFTPDGPIPSDGGGRVAAVAAVLLALSIAVASRARVARRRVLRAAVAARRAIRSRRRSITVAAAILIVSGLALAATGAARAPVNVVSLTSGWSGAAVVESRTAADGSWSECPYSRVAGVFNCRERGQVGASTATIPSELGSGNAYLAPAVMAWPGLPDTTFRIRLARRLAGSYVAGTVGKGVAAELRVAGRDPIALTRNRVHLEFESAGAPVPMEITLSRPGGGAIGFVMLNEDALGIDRRTIGPAAPAVPPAF